MRHLKDQNPEHKFFFCGPRLSDEMRAKLQTHCPELGMTILGNLGLDWAKSDFGPRPVLVNFSTSPSEDFGVSVAQAQENGMGLVLSEWGAHLDVRGEDVDLINPENLFLKRWEFTAPKAGNLPDLDLGLLKNFSWDELSEARDILLLKHREENLDYANTQKLSPELNEIIQRSFLRIPEED